MTTKESESLSNIYLKFFEPRNCQTLLKNLNRYSVVDAILTSGGTNGITSIILEFKRRDCSISKYHSCLIEVDKYKSLQRVASDFDGPAFYVCEYNETVLVYHLDFCKYYQIEMIPCQTSETDPTQVLKPCYLLPYSDCTYIISKRTWATGSYNQLQKYIDDKIESERIDVTQLHNI